MEQSKAPLPVSQTGTLTGWVGVAIATCAGVGTIPLAPGTFGALVGVLLFIPLARAGAVPFVIAVLVLCALGVWASDRAEEVFASKDDGRIVIDELVGQLITLTPLLAFCGPSAFSCAPAHQEGAILEGPVFFSLVVTGFVAFRVFDIAKPGPVRWAERNISGGAGVMADDCVAGVFGAIVLAVPTFVLLTQSSGVAPAAGGY